MIFLEKKKNISIELSEGKKWYSLKSNCYDDDYHDDDVDVDFIIFLIY